MQEIHMNFLALAVSAAAKWLFGGLWYSPPLFAKSWQMLSGVPAELMKKNLVKFSIMGFVGDFIMAFVLVHAIRYAGATTFPMGAAVGFLYWLGFVATVSFIQTSYEGRPIKLWLINNGYLMISLALMGGVLAVWV